MDIAVLLVLLYPMAITAEITLVSSVEQNGRTAACPQELVTFTCTVTQGVSLNWASTAFTSCNSTPTYTLEVSTSVGSISICGSFQANLTAITNRTQMQGSIQADLTSTLSTNITVSPGTMVTCSDLIVGSSLSKSYPIIASLPSPPQSPTTTVHNGPDNITVIVQWDYPLRDGGAPVDNYTVTLVGPGAVHLSTTTSVQPMATFTLAYNEEYTVSIAATNCVGTGGTVSLNISEVGCGAPPPPINGSLLQPDTNTTAGSVVVFQCDPGFVPEGEMTAVCESDGQWTPNPGGVTCSLRPTQTFTQAATPTQTSTPTGPGSSTPVPQAQPWVVPVVVVFVCVLVISCVVIVIIVGIIVVRRKQSEVPKKLDASSDHLELRSPTMDEISEPSRSQGETTVIEAQYHVVQETSEKATVVPAEYSSVVQISGQRPQVPGKLMYADLGPHIQAPVRPPSTADTVQYSSLLHGEAVQAPLAPADKSLNLDNLIVQLQHVDITKWHQLGEALGIPKRRLNDITFHHSAEPDQCKVEVLDYWLRNRTRPTWREVADALTQIHESELANSLREVYTTGVLPVTVDMRSLPRSTFGESPPPPLPPKQFSDDDLLPSLECHEPPQNFPPPRLPKAQQNKPPPQPTAPPRPPKGHQRGAPPDAPPDAPPRPPKPGQF